MPCFMCVTCGTQHAESDAPPARCAVCEDARQYVPESGQRWTTHEAALERHRNVLLDDDAAAEVERRGGLAAIAISHPHYYSAMVEWARAFACPVLLHAADAEWIMRPDPALELWDGETRSLGEGLTLVRCGGHFAGG